MSTNDHARTLLTICQLLYWGIHDAGGVKEDVKRRFFAAYSFNMGRLASIELESHLRNSLTPRVIESKLAKLISRKMASFPVSAFSCEDELFSVCTEESNNSATYVGSPSAGLASQRRASIALSAPEANTKWVRFGKRLKTSVMVSGGSSTVKFEGSPHASRRFP